MTFPRLLDINELVPTVFWAAGQDSFAADAPNAALIIKDIQTGGLDTAIIELFNPMYDMNSETSKPFNIALFGT